MDVPAAGVSIPAAGRFASEPLIAQPKRMQLTEVEFRAMGCDCKVLALGGSAELLSAAQSWIADLDQRWSRFIPTSDLSRFNASAGSTRRVSREMLVLLRYGAAGFRWTNGLFDPFLGEAIKAAGYDRDFRELAADRELTLTQSVGGHPTIGTPRGQLRSPLRLDITRRIARLDAGTSFDSGGIGKGLGADLVVAKLLSAGASGAMVSLGGDVAVGGSYPDQGWRVGIENPVGTAGAGDLSVVLRSGSLCSSGIVKRRWLRPDGSSAHHVIDPTTGEPLVGGGVVAASAIASAGWRAEVLTKAALVGGEQAARRLIARNPNCALLLWDNRGEQLQIHGSG